VRPQLIDVVAGRSATRALEWLDVQPEAWKQRIRYGVLDLSGPYRKVFTDGLGHVTQVADPFHVVKLANSKLDECRRRVQTETLGHRGREEDPLHRARRLLTKAHKRLDDRGDTKLRGLLAAGDPRSQVRTPWHAKETVRDIYDIGDPDVAGDFVAQLGLDLQDESCPPEVQSLGRTLRRWLAHITAWHKARVTNGPTEAINNRHDHTPLKSEEPDFHTAPPTIASPSCGRTLGTRTNRVLLSGFLRALAAWSTPAVRMAPSDDHSASYAHYRRSSSCAVFHKCGRCCG
jgi:transposase